MQLTIPSSNLARSIDIIKVAAPSNAPNAIHQNALFIATGNSLAVTGNDGTIQVTHCETDLEIAGTGSVLVRHDRLREIASLTNGKLEFSERKNVLRIDGPQCAYGLPTEEVESFPVWNSLRGEAIELDGTELGEAIGRVLFAAGEDQSARGVQISIDGGKLHLVATDGKRLAWHWLKVNSESCEPVLVPIKAMQFVAGICKHAEAIEMRLTKSMASFASGGDSIIARLIESRTINYKSVVPKNSKYKIQFQCGELLHSVRRAALMADDENNRINMQFADGLLRLRSLGASTGEADIEHPLPSFKGQLAIQFMPRHLIDVLKALPADAAITLELTDATTPAVIRCGPHYLCVIVPLAAN